ncbi:thioredoxin [Tepidamorphus sp. 3E244]|uniref:thioredoxin n=1 Tax=Tepidamorphus sp. 3E244 TaxID=3385498 RepID=UPI0038FCE0A1
MNLNDGLIGSAPSAPGGDDLIKDTTTDTFMRDVVEASAQVPVLVDFWAPWCGPCKSLTPALESAVRAAKGAVKLVKMNIEEHPQIAGQMGVQSIPAVFAFKQGKPVDGFMGALPEGQIKEFIGRLLGEDAPGADLAEVIDAADTALAEGRAEEAASAYATVLREDQANLPAIAGLAKSLVAMGDLTQAREVLNHAPQGTENDPVIAGAVSAIELAEQAGNLGDAGELAARVEADPADFEARFDLATALAARGDRVGAVEQLIEIVRRNREWNEDGARKQLLQFFEAWGPKDEATQEGRRRLASVLFS